jgi:rhodanese-related sulfurtransferase
VRFARPGRVGSLKSVALPRLEDSRASTTATWTFRAAIVTRLGIPAFRALEATRIRRSQTPVRTGRAVVQQAGTRRPSRTDMAMVSLAVHDGEAATTAGSCLGPRMAARGGRSGLIIVAIVSFPAVVLAGGTARASAKREQPARRKPRGSRRILRMCRPPDLHRITPRLSLAVAALVAATGIPAPSQAVSASSSIGPAPISGIGQTESQVILSEAGLRRLTKHHVEPTYPKESLTAGVQGIVVAQVLVAADGSMSSIDVLQAPDENITSSVTRALMQWTFESVRDPQNRPARVKAKMFWYFVIRDGHGLILTAEQLAAERKTAAEAARDPSSFPVISQDDFRVLLGGSTTVVLLDVQSRSSFAGRHLENAVNIPEDELGLRTMELPKTGDVVVDCPRALADRCTSAVRVLADAGFTHVHVLKRQ